MKYIFIPTLIIFVSITCCWENSGAQNTTQSFRHHISVNPLNAALFQQIGITYEYKAGTIGFGITPGYIYPNKMKYSNWFIAGPTDQGSLGDYSGFFVIPQLYIHLTELQDEEEGGVIYLSPKFVYKYMHIDSTKTTAWSNLGDGYYSFKRMKDNVNIYGIFADFGFRYFLGHFFIDLNFGPGLMWVDHSMTIYGEKSGTQPDPMHYLGSPRYENSHTRKITINFTLNLGAAL